MNLREASGLLRNLAFRALRATIGGLPGGRISAFGAGPDRIGSILIVNLDRQPTRWRRMLRELGRFQTSEGAPLTSIATRLAAVDARDGRAVAATVDVDPNYRLGDQLYVQPDARLEKCFGLDEPIRMTRQEVAVARSHVEVWKAVAEGLHEHVLVLEDDSGSDAAPPPPSTVAGAPPWSGGAPKADRTCSTCPTRMPEGRLTAPTPAAPCSGRCAVYGSSPATSCPARVLRRCFAQCR